MFKLVKLSLHNWYVIDAQDIPIHGNTAIIGQTGAGKSSILDAIQTIISGNNRNIIELNAAAGEKRGRTVKDYILGKVSDYNEGKSRRDNCEATIAMTLYDEQKDKYVCLGLMFRVSEDDNEKTRRFLIENYDFSIEKFITKQQEVMSHKDMIQSIEDQNCSVQFYQNSIKFVTAYLEKLRPVLTPDPKHFLRSFSNTLQAKEISNPTEFVRKFVLEPIDLNITGIRSSIQNWKDLTLEVENIENKIIEISDVFKDYKKAFKYIAENSIIKEKLIQNKIKSETSSIEHFESSIYEAVKDIDNLNSQKDDLKIKIRNYNSQFSMEDNTAKISALRKNLSFIYPTFSDKQKAFLKTMGKNIPNENLAEEHFDDLTNTTEHLEGALQLTTDAERQLRDEIFNETEIHNSVKNNKPIYSAHSKQFMAILENNQIPYTNCLDVIYINDKKWSNAIEILLGLNKECFLFEDYESEKEAFRILENNKNSLFKVRIIARKKLEDYNARKLPSGSIVSYIDFKDQEIQKFVNQQIGRFVGVDTVDELTQHEFAITPNGEGISGLIKRVNTTPTRQIRQDNVGNYDLNSTQENISRNKKKLSEVQENKELINACIQKGKQIKENFKSILETQKEIQYLVESSKDVEPDVAIDIDSLQDKIENIQEKINSKNVVKLMNDEKAKNAKLNIENLKEELEILKEERISQDNLEVYDILEKEEVEFNYNIRSHHKDETIFNLFQSANTKLMRFAQKWIVDVPLSEQETHLSRLKWIYKEYQKLTQNDLRQYRKKLISATHEMENALKSGLLSQLLESFELLDQQLNNLNNRLYKYSFVGQKYIFKKSPNTHMKPIIEIVKVLKQNKDFSIEDMQKNKTLELGLKFIETMLSEESVEIKLFEDYRNYFEFELYIEHEDPDGSGKVISTPFSNVMGILSGGQRQAPYYVAIAASMVNTYYPKSHDNDFEGMGVLAFDEAFNKLDIPNTQRLMNLFKNLGLQVIVAAPEEKRSSLIEAIDSIISVSRIPGTDNVFIDSIKIGEKAKSEMLIQNPIHKMNA